MFLKFAIFKSWKYFISSIFFIFFLFINFYYTILAIIFLNSLCLWYFFKLRKSILPCFIDAFTNYIFSLNYFTWFLFFHQNLCIFHFYYLTIALYFKIIILTALIWFASFRRGIIIKYYCLIYLRRCKIQWIWLFSFMHILFLFNYINN